MPCVDFIISTLLALATSIVTATSSDSTIENILHGNILSVFR